MNACRAVEPHACLDTDADVTRLATVHCCLRECHTGVLSCVSVALSSCVVSATERYERDKARAFKASRDVIKGLAVQPEAKKFE